MSTSRPFPSTPVPTPRSSAPATSSHRRARRDLAVFLGLVTLLSAPLELAIGRTEALRNPTGVLLVAPLMWMPALASVLTRLVTRRGFDDLSFRRAPRMLRLLWWPLAVAAPVYAAAVAVGLVHLDPPPPGQWVALVVAATVVNLVLVPGEEIGWRGLMVPLIVEAKLPAPLLISGVIWGLWHVPLVLWGGFVPDGPAPWVSAALLVVVATALGHRLAVLRMESGSTLPPIVLHTAWNVAFQAVFEVAVVGYAEGLWLGEAGVLTSLVVLAVVAVRHRPGSKPSPALAGAQGEVR